LDQIKSYPHLTLCNNSPSQQQKQISIHAATFGSQSLICPPDIIEVGSKAVPKGIFNKEGKIGFDQIEGSEVGGGKEFFDELEPVNQYAGFGRHKQ
jgi:hypothetical protein